MAVLNAPWPCICSMWPLLRPNTYNYEPYSLNSCGCGASASLFEEGSVRLPMTGTLCDVFGCVPHPLLLASPALLVLLSLNSFIMRGPQHTPFSIAHLCIRLAVCLCACQGRYLFPLAHLRLGSHDRGALPLAPPPLGGNEQDRQNH